MQRLRGACSRLGVTWSDGVDANAARGVSGSSRKHEPVDTWSANRWLFLHVLVCLAQ